MDVKIRPKNLMKGPVGDADYLSKALNETNAPAPSLPSDSVVVKKQTTNPYYYIAAPTNSAPVSTPSPTSNPAPNPYVANPDRTPYTANDIYKNITSMNTQSADAYAKSVNAKADAEQKRLEAQKYYANQNYELGVKAAQGAMDTNISKLPENLAGIGLYGQGVGETAIANIRNNYANQLTELMRQRDNSIYEIDSQINTLRSQAEADIYNYNAQVMAQNPANYLEALRIENDNYWKGQENRLRVAEVTGTIDGEDTADMKKHKDNVKLDEGDMLGEYDGQDTLKKKAQVADYTGQYDGKDTFEKWAKQTELFGVDPVTGELTFEYKNANNQLAYDYAALESTEMKFWEEVKRQDSQFHAKMILEWANYTQGAYEFEASQKNDKKTQAEATIWSLVSMGQTPSDKLLEAAGLLGEKAGITAAAKLAETQAAYGMMGGSGGGSSGGGGGGRRSSGGSGGSGGSSSKASSSVNNEYFKEGGLIYTPYTYNYDPNKELNPVYVGKDNMSNPYFRTDMYDDYRAAGYTDAQARNAVEVARDTVVNQIAVAEGKTNEEVLKKYTGLNF